MIINPLRIKALITDMQAQISSINSSEIVIDDSQLTKFLEELKIVENYFLLAIIPEYPLTGDQDRLKWKNQLMFMILKKTNDKNIKHNEFISVLDETLAAATQFVEILISEKSGDEGDFCGIANELVENSIKIYPIWNKSGCNGWGIDVDLLTNP